MSRLVYHVLMNLCKKRANTIIRRVNNHDGFEAYRRLHVRFDVQTEGRQLSDLSQLMEPQWGTDEDEFEGELE